MVQELSVDKQTQELAMFLTELFSVDRKERVRHAESFHRHFVNVVRSALANPQWEEAMRGWASQSYRHENGFLKLVAFCTPCSAFRLRVHVWPLKRECNVQRLNVHNHRYSFISFVARGEIDDHLWLPNESGSTFNRFIYRPRDETGCYLHEYTGTAELGVDQVRRYCHGQLYSLDPSELHCSVPIGVQAPVTFFVEDRRSLRDHAITYSRHQNAVEQRIYTPSVSFEQYVHLLNTYVVSALC
jgi:hypothetical protein